MATVTKRLSGDQWVQIPATWAAYLRLDHARGESANPRLIYCDRRLTIVTKGCPHEFYKARISFLLELMFMELEIRFSPTAEMTLKEGNREKKGIEADASYYLTNLDGLTPTRKVVMGVDPAPDLAVEIVISHPVEDSLAIYSAFGVREVWVCGDGGITFLIREDEGQYQEAERSFWLPFLSSEEMSTWLFPDTDKVDEMTFRRAYREWLLNTLLPRHQQIQGENS
jgi:Uma2 family endonuclease